MKIRMDFVTNSSSSSFIVQKSEKFKTKDDLFKFIQEQYRTLLKNLEKAKKYCEEKGHPIIVDKYGFLNLDSDCFDDIRDKWAFEDEVKEKTGFDFGFLYYFNQSEVEKIINAKNYEDYNKLRTKSKYDNEELIYDGLEEFEKDDDEDHWGKDELIGWYSSDDKYLSKYFIAEPEELEQILKDCLIIYESEGSRYHFHDILEELGEICIGHCTHMG